MAGRRRLLGAALAVVGVSLVGASFGLEAWAHHRGTLAAGTAQPLTPAERTAVHNERVVVANLGLALRLIPTAVADGGSAGGPRMTETEALAVVSHRGELAALSAAIRQPDSVQIPLDRALAAADTTTRPVPFPPVWVLLLVLGAPGVAVVVAGSLIDGRSRQLVASAAAATVLVGLFVPLLPHGTSLWSGARENRRFATPPSTAVIETDLAAIQAVYDEIVPAVKAAASSRNMTLSDTQAIDVIRSDPRLVRLRQVVTGLSALYGAGVLATQASASATPNSRRRAFTAIPWVALVLADLLALIVVASCWPYRREALSPPER